MDLQLESFDISPITGFLPEKQPETLKGDNFCEWERIAKSVYRLIEEKKVIQAVNDLPDIEFSFTTLHTKEVAPCICHYIFHCSSLYIRDWRYSWSCSTITTKNCDSLAQDS